MGRGRRRRLDEECFLCGAAPQASCVKGHVSLAYGSSKRKRAPHFIYSTQLPFAFLKQMS